MAGCKKEIEVYVPKGVTYVPIRTTCGSTGYYGEPEFCDECAPKYEDRDWRREAEENGEQWDSDY